MVNPILFFKMYYFIKMCFPHKFSLPTRQYVFLNKIHNNKIGFLIFDFFFGRKVLIESPNISGLQQNSLLPPMSSQWYSIVEKNTNLSKRTWRNIFSTVLDIWCPYCWNVLYWLSVDKICQTHCKAKLQATIMIWWKYVYWCNICTNFMGTTSYFLFGIKAYSMR